MFLSSCKHTSDAVTLPLRHVPFAWMISKIEKILSQVLVDMGFIKSGFIDHF